MLDGNIGRAVIKTSAIKENQYTIKAPAKVFHSQDEVIEAFKSGALLCDFVCVLRFQGPKANGMPELHGLTPVLGAIAAQGYKVALVTDGRMSGASGKIPAALHVCPEACTGGAIAKIQSGDMMLVDAANGRLQVLAEDFDQRSAAQIDITHNQNGCGRELFSLFRDKVGAAEAGASVFF